MAAHLGVLQLQLMVSASGSLKDKRRVIKSIKDRLGNPHNVSVAEVDDLNDRKQSTLAVALVSNDRRFNESCLSKIVDQLRMHPEATLLDYRIECF